jgi:putative protein-disulfide isomerase
MGISVPCDFFEMFMNSPQLTLFTDPYCLWCYAFAPVLDAWRSRSLATTPVRLVQGSLFTGKGVPSPSPQFVHYLQQHARRATDASGVAFGPAFWKALSAGMRFDSQMASTALAAIHQLAPHLSLAALERLQKALFQDGIDLSGVNAIKQVLADLPLDWSAWHALIADGRSGSQLQADQVLCRRLSIHGFPALALKTGERSYTLLASGFSSAEMLQENWRRVQTAQAGKGIGAQCTDAGCAI